MNRNLRKSLMALMGVAALTGVSTQAAALTSFENLGTLGAVPLSRSQSGALYGWDGQNNGKLGWTHSTDWTVFTLAAPATVEVRAESTPTAGRQNTLVPAFTLWATDAGFIDTNHNPNYSWKPVGVSTTHPYNVVQGPPANLTSDRACPGGGCNSNNWLAPNGGGNGTYPTPSPPTPDGITGLVGYANAGPRFTNGNGDLVSGTSAPVGSNTSPIPGAIGSGYNGVVTAQSPDWSAAAGGPTHTVQFADLILYNLPAGTYFMASSGSCSNTATCADQIAATTTAYKLTISQLSTPVPVPAAVWLFGSALAGLIGLGRRSGKEPV